MVSEWPRPSKTWKSVTAGLVSYMATTSFVTFSATVWSSVPEVDNRGPRSARPVSTLAGECGRKFAGGHDCT
jgi:hypothetical protein